MAIGTPTTIGQNAFFSSSTTVVLTITAATSVSNKIIVFAACEGASTTATCADSQLNTYSVDATANLTQNACFFIFSSDQDVQGLLTSDTITVTFSTARSDRLISGVQVSGLTIGGLDKKATNNGGVGTNPDSGLTVTTTQTDELVIGGCIENAATYTSVDPGSTLTEIHDFANTDAVGIETEYKIVSSTGTYRADGVFNGTNGVWNAAVATYKGVASAAVSFAMREVIIPNKFVGPMALRMNFRQQPFPSYSTTSGPFNYTQALTATLSFVGNLTKSTSYPLSGALSFTGNFAKSTFRSLTGGLSFTGSFTKMVNKVHTGSLSFTGVFSKLTGRTLPASLSFAGGLSRLTSRVHTAMLSFTGAMAKRTSRAYAGVLSFAGAIASSKAANMFFTASLSFTGSISKQTQKALPATLSFTGSINRLIFKGLSSTLSFVGTIGKGMKQSFTASLSFIGTIGSVYQPAVAQVAKATKWFLSRAGFYG